MERFLLGFILTILILPALSVGQSFCPNQVTSELRRFGNYGTFEAPIGVRRTVRADIYRFYTDHFSVTYFAKGEREQITVARNGVLTFITLSKSCAYTEVSELVTVPSKKDEENTHFRRLEAVATSEICARLKKATESGLNLESLEHRERLKREVYSFGTKIEDEEGPREDFKRTERLCQNYFGT